MQKVGIFGGSRFIGYHLVLTLYREGYEIALFNRGKTIPPMPFPEDIKQIQGDRNRESDLRELFCEDFDFIIDLSGYTPAHVEPIVKTYRKSIGHYLFCSTSSVYKVPPPYPLNEDSPRTFVAKTYGGDKALIEEILLSQYMEDRWPVTIFCPQGVFGPHGAYQAWFILYRLLHSIPISVKQGSNFRINFLYINDLMNAFLSAMRNSVSHGAVYGVAGDDVTSQTEFIEKCGKVSPCKPLLHFVDDPTYDDIHTFLTYK